MNADMPTLDPAELDAWLRKQLGRRMVVLGLTLPVAPVTYGAQEAQTGDPPALLAAALEKYSELWLRWAAHGVALPAALAEAATHDADVVLVWLTQPPAAGETGTPTDATSDAPSMRVLQSLIGQMEATGLRDRCVVVVVGPGASRGLARRLGCDDGFGPEASPSDIAATLAREVTARAAFLRRGQSPPCYL